MPKTPTEDMAAAIGKIVAHDGPPLMLARARSERQPPKSLFATACEQIAAIAGRLVKIEAKAERITDLEARLAAAEARLARIEAGDDRPAANGLIRP